MKTVYLLIGLHEAEKSTFAKTKLKISSIIELDKIRQQFDDAKVVDKEHSFEDNCLVFKKFHKKILNEIKINDSVVIDTTNTKVSERQDIYDLLKEYKPKFIAINFMDDIDVVDENTKKCQTQNPNYVLKNHEEIVDTCLKRIEENKTSFDEPLAEIWYVKSCKLINKEQKILIASTNLGKIKIYKEICDELNLYTTSLNEIGVNVDIEETGETEIQNAELKAKAYHEITGLPVIANDSGLIIDKFSKEDQPGVLVRRFGGKELTDKELLSVFVEKLTEVGGESTGHYNVALSLIDSRGKITSKVFNPKKYFINKPSEIIIKGIPLSSISYDKSLNKYESEMTMKERNDQEKEEMQKQKEFIKFVFCK